MSRRQPGGSKRQAAGGATTPAVRLAVEAAVDFRLHEYAVDPRHAGSGQQGSGHPGFGEEAVQALGLSAERVFKTLVVALDGDDRRLAVAVLPVRSRLAPKRLAAALGARSAALADVTRAERATGYVAGGISPLGQRSALPTALDESAFGHASVFVSGGRRGLEIELAPADLLRLASAVRAVLVTGA